MYYLRYVTHESESAVACNCN